MIRKIEGWQIREIRRALQVSQVQLAGVLGVHPVSVSRWENKNTIPLTAFQTAILDFAREEWKITKPRLKRPSWLYPQYKKKRARARK